MVTEAKNTKRGGFHVSPDRAKELGIDPDELELFGYSMVQKFDQFQGETNPLKQDREDAFRAYQSEKYGNEVPGRSQIVTSDVSDTVEAIMPQLMRIFMSTNEVVTAAPKGPRGDTEKAKLIEHKLNHDISTDPNNGYAIFHDWFKDALLQKPGIVTLSWIKGTKRGVRRTYADLSFIEYQVFLQREADDEFEIIDRLTKKRPAVDEDAEDFDAILDEAIAADMDPDELFIYDITGYENEYYSHPFIENLPAEEFVFDITAKSLKKSFCARKVEMHKNKVALKYGIDPDTLSTGDEDDLNTEKATRAEPEGGLITNVDDKDFIYMWECYYPYYGKDGEPMAMKTTISQGAVLDIEENVYGKPLFFDLTAIRMSHKVVGRAIAELAEHFQKMRTAMLRLIMDNMYFQNNAMKVVNPFRINAGDLVNNNYPGGIVRTIHDTDPKDGIFPVPTSPLPPHTFRVWELLEQQREGRTGVSRNSLGMMNKNLTRSATGMNRIMDAAQERVGFIARTFAEIGVKEFFQALLDLNLQFLDKPVSVKVNEGWQEIGPEDIDGRYDISIDIASGLGSKEQRAMQLNQMLQTYDSIAGLLNSALNSPFIPPEEKYKLANLVQAGNVQNMLKSLWEALGFKDTGRFVPDMQELAQEATEYVRPGGGIPPGPGGIGPPGPGGPGIAGQPAPAGVLPGSGVPGNGGPS
jgi:hypothetical protein